MGAEFDDDEIPMGSVCIDRAGSVGVVSHFSQSCGRSRCGLVMYYGRTLEGRHWQTGIPTKLADTLEEYQRNLLGESQ